MSSTRIVLKLPSQRNTFRQISLYIILFCSLHHVLIAQNPRNLKFKTYGINEGLSQVTAKCLLEDQQGFIWVGTQDGLNRFDGYSFKVFRNDPEKPNSLSSSFISCLFQTSDGRIIVGTNAGVNIFNSKNETFETLQLQSDQSRSLGHNVVTEILEDSKHRIWIGTENGLHLIDSTEAVLAQFHHSTSAVGTISDSRITSIFEDLAGNIWIGTENGLNLFDQVNETFLSFHHSPSEISSLSSNEITEIFQDHKGLIWVGTTNGLNQFDKNRKSRRYFYDPNDNTSISDNTIFRIFQDSNQNLWIGTSNGGLNLFNYANHTFFRYQHDADDPFSLSNNTIWSMIEDRTGNLWIGVSNRGLNFHDPKTQNFEHLKYQPNSAISLMDNAVRSILLDNEEQLWVGSFTGLTVINKEKNKTKWYQHNHNDPHSLVANYVRNILQDHQKRVWVGTSNGLNVYNPNEDNFLEFQINNEIPFKNISIASIHQGHENDVWIGTEKNGIYRVNPEKKILRNYNSSEMDGLSHPTITSIFKDSQNRLWVGTINGFNLFDPLKDSFVQFTHSPGNSSTISNNTIKCIVEGQKGEIWVGTNEGLNRLDPKTNTFTSYRMKDGLSNDVIYGALADNRGFLWLSTNKGINKFDPEAETFIIYDQEDGLQSDEFNSLAYHKDKHGFLYFGGVNGLSIFHPDSVSDNTYIPPVVLTNFLLFNKSVNVSDSTILPESLNDLHEIVLKHHDDMFAFEFSTLNYKQPKKNQFAYKLEPFNKDWIYTSFDDRKAVFTRIPPGDYTFHVKASNDDGYWNEQAKTIEIRILPPWWLTWWAILLYTLITLAIIALIVRFQWKRVQLKHKLKQEQREAEQFKILNELKTQFFSNITHEFRTPLTLIIGPSEQILMQQKLDESFTRTQVEMVLRNSKKFLHLINQLLDLSKLESKQMSLDLYQGDFNKFVKNIVEQFESAAEQKKVRLGFHSQLPVNDYLFDRDKVDKIFFNLLSNALKFTPEGGLIEVKLHIKEGTELKTNNVTITVEDNGVGIPFDQLNQIFNRFHQVDSSTKKKQGTGIGLALVKELIEVHGGGIEVASEIGKGTIFTVSLPLQVAICELQDEKPENNDEKQPIDLSYSTLNEANSTDDEDALIDLETNQPIVLIIEDNNDLRNFIKSVIGASYQTITAKDGVEGIEMALKYIPDLIISDIMMPEKDGFEVTHSLKNNPLSSHIPIILLSAKSTLQSRVTGFQEGADAYLIKPFSIEELTLVAKRQIENRKILQAKFSNSSNKEESEMIYHKIDQELVDKLHKFIEANLSNEDLVVDELVREVGMSHSQLYRKIKALTDMSIASFIRNYRLTRALELLKSGEHNVTEVANMSGFGDRRYFHKAFVDKFNYPPSQVLKK